MDDMELDLSQFELVEAPKECVLKKDVAWTVEGKGVFQSYYEILCFAQSLKALQQNVFRKI